MHLRAAAAAGLILMSAAPAAAAESAATVTAKLAQAAASVRSFVVELQVAGAGGVGATLTFVRPTRVKSTFTIGTMTVQSYMIDGVVYVHSPYTGWQKTTVDALHAPAQSADIAQLLAGANVTLLPDRIENGRRLGAFATDVTLPAPSATLAPAATPATQATPETRASPGAQAPPAVAAAPQHLICTYDRPLYRLQTCTSDAMAMTYSRYDDPANVVELPPEAAAATPAATGSPAPP